jgi:hypothetical protein
MSRAAALGVAISTFPVLLMLLLVPGWARTSFVEADSTADGGRDARDTSRRDQLLPRLLPGQLPSITAFVYL